MQLLLGCFFWLHAASPSFSACAVLHSMTFSLLVATAVTSCHLVIEFLHLSLAYLPNPGFRDHHFCIFPLILLTITCTQLNLGCFFKKIRTSRSMGCVFHKPGMKSRLILKSDVTPLPVDNTWLMEFGTQSKNLNQIENISVLLNGSIGLFHILAYHPTPFAVSSILSDVPLQHLLRAT